jgi:non-ribosomal peptide synthetase component F
VKKREPFRKLLMRVHEAVLAAYARQQLPFGRLVRELRPNAGPAYTPLFQVMFFFLSLPVVQSLAGLTWNNLEAYGETSRYDLLLSLWDKPENVSGVLEYNTDLFDQKSAGRIAAAMEKMLEHLVKDFDQPVERLSAITAETWNASNVPG